MPLPGDYTSMWWRDGFPAKVEGAEWIRCIRSGHYAMAMNTQTLEIPHLGPVPPGVPYAASNWLGTDWTGIPSAKLELVAKANGKTYRCTKGGKWTRFSGPRLIISGRYLQRADVTGLEFTAGDGAKLNLEAHLESMAWPDRLGFQLSARPGLQAIQAGEASFGRVGGGFGLTGHNHLAIPHKPELDPKVFTLELWAFVPKGFQAHPRTPPWLVCKNHHEQFQGNYGIFLLNGQAQARLNIGGGRQAAYTAAPHPHNKLRLDAWNHLAMSYDGETLRLYTHGQLAAEKKIGLERQPGKHPLVIGRRLAGGNNYSFRGIVDEIRIYDRALTLQEIRGRANRPEVARLALKPVAEWLFRKEGKASMGLSREPWEQAKLEIQLSQGGKTLSNHWEPIAGEGQAADAWRRVRLWLDPKDFNKAPMDSAILVSAKEIPGGKPRPVVLDQGMGAFRINLDKMEPQPPKGVKPPSNDAIERVRLALVNPTSQRQTARLVFEKTWRGIRQRIGVPITGVSAILRDKDGNPTGIPVQLSKNWHNDPQGNTYSGQWFHGVSQVQLPPDSSTELELTLAYGHWGGIPAVSHSQLSLIGWGGNQLWEQSAFGAWGESICFDPEQAQAGVSITDVRPLMVKPMGNPEKWNWTVNVGGGDLIRLFGKDGKRIPHTAMKSTYHRQGPCLTEVTHSGKAGQGIQHWCTASLSRSDDLVRGTYRFRMEVKEPTDFSRLVLFQVGADTYNHTQERKFAVGNETGLLREWEAQWGGNTYRTKPAPWEGDIPWASLHDGVRPATQPTGDWANRGIVLREWKAQLGGKPVPPWFAERGHEHHRRKSSTFDLLPPSGLSRLEPGDFVEAVVEHLVFPQSAEDYYGPNQALREALAKHGNTWQMVHREAIGHDIHMNLQTGTFLYRHPGLFIRTDNGKAKFEIQGGTAYVPVTFTGLPSHDTPHPTINGQPFSQAVHGNDFWQTDFDPGTKTWSRTYNLPPSEKNSVVELVAPANLPE